MRVPRLRFQEFNEKWLKLKLNELAKVYDGTHQTPTYQKEGIKFLSVENINTLKTSKYISKGDFEKNFKIRPEYNDILMTRIGDIGTANIIKDNDIYAYYVSLALIKTKKINPEYLLCFIESRYFQKELHKRTLHVAFPKKINMGEIGECYISTPINKNEQIKIGFFFKRLNEKIKLQQEKIDLLKEQKKGYMQRIFSQELRFKGEDGQKFPDWENTFINNVCEVGSCTRVHQKDWTSNGIPFFRARDIVAINNGEETCPLFISEETYKEKSSKSGIVKKGDVMITGVGTIGVPYLIQDENPIYFKDGNVIWLKNLNEINGKFLYYTILSQKVQNFIKTTSGLGTVGTYTIENAKKTPLRMPCIDEQEKIVLFLDKIHEKIEVENKKMQYLTEQKQAFMQQMFI